MLSARASTEFMNNKYIIIFGFFFFFFIFFKNHQPEIEQICPLGVWVFGFKTSRLHEFLGRNKTVGCGECWALDIDAGDEILPKTGSSSSNPSKSDFCNKNDLWNLNPILLKVHLSRSEVNSSLKEKF